MLNQVQLHTPSKLGREIAVRANNIRIRMVIPHVKPKRFFGLGNFLAVGADKLHHRCVSARMALLDVLG